MTVTPRIFLFHATPVAMAPVTDAMRRLWPEAEAVNILDESLSLDRAREVGHLSPGLSERFVALGRQAVSGRADGILITCSAFGPAIRRLSSEIGIPVLMPNEAMFRAAITAGSNIGMVATFAPAVETMEDEFREFAAEVGSPAKLRTIIADGAIEKLRQGNVVDHDASVADAALVLADCDAIMLAHFSTARAAGPVGERVDCAVLTAPSSAVTRMKQLMHRQEH
ncbi:aspartate/glutamate racemase family protein [Rhizobium sp.]|uniref:aspartate/glutamate racemase family protein n=1 Tax=Rhizobium sp. TaxID=391 RepID=UPI0028ACB59C